MKDKYNHKKLGKKKKKKRINSRAKGNTFERKIAKLLNETFNLKEFSRTPGSGAYATTHELPEHLKIYGDLITPKKFKYTVECKKGYNKENIISLLNYSSDLWKFIEQSEKDAEKSGKEPLMIYQQDRQPAIAVVRKTSFPKRGPNIEVKKYRIYYLDDLLKLEKSYCFTQDEQE